MIIVILLGLGMVYGIISALTNRALGYIAVFSIFIWLGIKCFDSGGLGLALKIGAIAIIMIWCVEQGFFTPSWKKQRYVEWKQQQDKYDNDYGIIDWDDK